MKQVQSVDDASAHQGKLILDATVVEQAIRFPTDLSLLNESREISEQITDLLHPLSGAKTKPRTYRQMARKDYLSIVKQRRPKGKKLRAGIKKQLQYLRRNLQHIEQLLDALPAEQYHWRILCCASTGLSNMFMLSKKRCIV